MRLVRTHSLSAHTGLFAPGEPLPLWHRLRAVLEEVPERCATHNPRDPDGCGCPGCLVVREAVGAALRSAAEVLAERRENGKPLKPFLNFVPETDGEREVARHLERNRGRRDYFVVLNVELYRAMRARGWVA